MPCEHDLLDHFNKLIYSDKFKEVIDAKICENNEKLPLDCTASVIPLEEYILKRKSCRYL